MRRIVDQDRLYSVEEAAKVLNIRPSTVRAEARKLKQKKFANKYFFSGRMLVHMMTGENDFFRPEV